MISIDPQDFSKSELKDLVRDHREQVEPLQEVKLSQNKDPLIADIEEALTEHLQQLGKVPEEGILDEITVDAGSLSPQPSSEGSVQDPNAGEEKPSEESSAEAEKDTGSGADSKGATEDESDDTSYGEHLRPLNL